MIALMRSLVWNLFVVMMNLETAIQKVVRMQSLRHLSNYLKGSTNSVCNTRNANQIKLIILKIKIFLSIFYITEWNKLIDKTIKKFEGTLMKDTKRDEKLLFVTLHS